MGIFENGLFRRKEKANLPVIQESSRGRNIPRREFLKLMLRGGEASLLLMLTQALGITTSFLENASFSEELKSRMERPGVTQKEKDHFQTYLHPEQISGPPTAKRDKFGRVEYVDAESKPLPHLFGVNMYGLMNTYDYYVQPGEALAKKERIEDIIIELKKQGVSYVRFLFTPEDYTGNPVSDEAYQNLQQLMDTLNRHGMGATVILNYWQGFSTSQHVKMHAEDFSSQELIDKQRHHLEKILDSIGDSPALWEVMFTNELVTTEGRNIARLAGADTKLPEFINLMNNLREVLKEHGRETPLSTGFLTMLQAGVIAPIVERTLLSFASNLPDLYHAVDTIPFTTSASDLNSVYTVEMRKVAKDNMVPLQFGEIGIHQHKGPRNDFQLQRVATDLAMHLYEYRPQQAAFWQIIDDDVPREGFDDTTLTLSEFIRMLGMLSS